MTTISDIRSGREDFLISKSEDDDEILLQSRKKNDKVEAVKNAIIGYAESEDTTLSLEEIAAESQTNQTMESNLPISREKVTLLQKWEGVVLKVASDTFWARLVDLKRHAIEEEAEFLIEEVPPTEREWLLPGNLFYWAISYRDSGGQRKRESSIRFRRDPLPTKKEFEQAKEEAEDIAQLFREK